MSFRPVFLRSPDDDGAPLDYSYVPSVNEGRRRQQEPVSYTHLRAHET